MSPSPGARASASLRSHAPRAACALPVPPLPLARQGVLLPPHRPKLQPAPYDKHRVTVSGEVAVGDLARPEQIHLAFADNVNEMQVLFVCGDAEKRVVRSGMGWTRRMR
jgi:hypothetical protein